MITIKEVACELQDILNGVSPNIPEGATRPITATFEAQCAGYHLDHVANGKENGNFFPVFVDSGTGAINPIKDVGQVDYSFPVSIYFPVRFRDYMLQMQDYLTKCLVGASLMLKVYGDDGKEAYKQGAITNMSAFEIGDITDMDLEQYGNPLKQFKEFVSANYRMPIASMEPWISLSFTLYVSTMDKANAKDGYIYGNEMSAELKMSDGSETFVEEVKCSGFSLEYTATAQPQQGFNLSDGEAEDEATNFTFTSARGFSCIALVRNNDFWSYFFYLFGQGTLSKATVELTIYGNGSYIEDFPPLECMITNAKITPTKGAPIAVQLTLAKKGTKR